MLLLYAHVQQLQTNSADNNLPWIKPNVHRLRSLFSEVSHQNVLSGSISFDEAFDRPAGCGH